MLDLSALYRRLEVATFTQREQIAAEVVRDTPRDELAPLVRGLEHPQQRVRLGVIEILQRAGYRESLRRLVQHARDLDGDDRVFAMRAIAQLAEPGDEFLIDSVRGWLTWSDPFVEVHAQKLADTLGLSPGRGVGKATTAGTATAAAPAAATVSSAAGPREPGAMDSLDKLVVRLFAADRGSERIALVEAIERRGPQALAAVAKLLLQKGNADLVAHACRAVIRHAQGVPHPEQLLRSLEAARTRLGNAPIAQAAIDDALLALAGVAISPALLARVGELDRAQLDALVARLGELAPGDVALHAPALLDALGRAPALWSAFGPVLAHAAPQLREGTRGELRGLVERVLDDLRKARPLPPVTLVSVCWVLARIAERGEPLPRPLRVALERLADAHAVRALGALCTRLATEEAAVSLIAMLRDPLSEARATAREALRAWQSPWVGVEGVPGSDGRDGSQPPTVAPHYIDDHGQPLTRRGGRLTAVSGDDYVLDARGRPVRASETESGGCLCCAPPRALIRRRGEGLRCPSSWESHLRDGGRTLLERDDALGRCKRCDSVRPRVRDGARVVCFDCGAGLPGIGGNGDGDGAMPPQDPPVPSEHGRAHRPDALPKPPSREELEHVAPAIRAAILANVFLLARDHHASWNGSGIIIARDGNHIAILTNRHVVESDDSQRLAAVTAMTVSGEAIPMTPVWRARRGVDLALVEGRVGNPESLGVMALGSGAVLVGAEVFAIGNPLGLAWSYSAGTLSAIRHWTTAEGESVRILQTDANIAPGSSGGGLFHRDGHLVGVMSFLRQGHAGGSAHFALSCEAIRQALVRDGVRWRGQLLGELPR